MQQELSRGKVSCFNDATSVFTLTKSYLVLLNNENYYCIGSEISISKAMSKWLCDRGLKITSSHRVLSLKIVSNNLPLSMEFFIQRIIQGHLV